MPRGEAAVRARAVVPARAATGSGALGVDALSGVEAQPGDVCVGVAGVRVDGDPLALAAEAPVHEGARVERRAEQAAAVQRVRDRAGAVVGRVAGKARGAAVTVQL